MAPEDRVIPLLCRDLLAKSQHFQCLHLQAFEVRNAPCHNEWAQEALPQLWRVSVLPADARLLLAVLLRILQHRDASTVFQRKQNWLAAAAALRALHALYTVQHLHFPLFLDTLKDMLKELHLDDEHLYQRATMVTEEELRMEAGARRLSTPSIHTTNPASPAAAEPLPIFKSPSVVSVVSPEPANERMSPAPEPSTIEKSVSGISRHGSAASTLTTVTTVTTSTKTEKPAKKAQVAPPDASAVDLPMDYLESIKAIFDDLDRDARGELGLNELLEFADKIGKDFTMHSFKRLDKAGTGLVGFVDVVRSWYPKVALRELQRKVALLPSAAETRRHKERAAIAAEFRKQAEERRRKEEEERAKFEEDRAWAEHLQIRRRSEAITSDSERQLRWGEFRERAVQRDFMRAMAQQVKAPAFIEVGTVKIAPSNFVLDAFLDDDTTRTVAINLLKSWDISGVNIQPMSQNGMLHVFVPRRFTQRGRVFRDYIICPPRPVANRPWTGQQHIHIKTNVRSKSDTMYRFTVEGYNYGVNAPIHSDIIGYTHRRWNKLSSMEDFGWPDGWDANSATDYASGATVSQYISKDGFVVIKLSSSSFTGVGFSVSAFFLNHDYGADFVITSSISHEDEDL